MNILIKDHKMWSRESGKAVPSRPMVSGNCSINTHLSELLSEMVEPLATEAEGMEVQSSEELLHLIDCINQKVVRGDNLNKCNVLSKFDESIKCVCVGQHNSLYIILQQDRIQTRHLCARTHALQNEILTIIIKVYVQIF